VSNYVRFALAIASALMIVGSVSAQSPVSAPPAQGKPKAGEPSEVICQKLEVIGSRLAVKKFCMTRSQWADSRLQDRQLVEKIQASPCVITQNGVTGRPSC
jgi:hypothetical protein